MDDDKLPKKEPDKAKVQAPPTEADRLKARLDVVEKENGDDRAKRRASEFAQHLEAHGAQLADVHRRYPVPHGVKWKKLTTQQKRDWNMRRKAITKLNREYHAACKATGALHQHEEHHLGKLRLAQRNKEAA